MKKIVLVIFLVTSLGAFAQSITQEDLQKTIKSLAGDVKILQKENNRLKADLANIDSKLAKANEYLDSLNEKTKANSAAITQTYGALGIKIKEAGDKTGVKITEVSESLSKNSLFGIIGVLSALILSGLLYWLLRKRQNIDKTNFIYQLSKTKSSIEESLVKEFGKQTELMDSQLHLIEKQKIVAKATSNADPDHSLALKLSSQINVMENNLNKMDQNVRGIKNLRHSISNLKDNLSANGYEMPELLGKQFHEGMKVIVTSTIPDENLEKDSEVITKVLIPQVNYNDKMIQTAQIETSKGY